MAENWQQRAADILAGARAEFRLQAESRPEVKDDQAVREFTEALERAIGDVSVDDALAALDREILGRRRALGDAFVDSILSRP